MKFTIETEDPEEIKILTQSSDMYNTLFELKYNFWRKWKHTDAKDSDEILDALQEELKDLGI